MRRILCQCVAVRGGAVSVRGEEEGRGAWWQRVCVVRCVCVYWLCVAGVFESEPGSHPVIRKNWNDTEKISMAPAQG